MQETTERPETVRRNSAATRSFLLDDIAPGGHILDVGCGDGNMMVELASRGCTVTGLDIDPGLVSICREKGLNVVEGVAETLPFETGTFDGIVSNCIPLTDERKTVAEWARVLKPGGFARTTCHGLGFGIHYVACGIHWKQRVYGARMLINTAWYGVAGRRIPGFFGDTLCQRPGRLHLYYDAVGFSLVRELIVSRFAGLPQYFGHHLVRTG